MADHRPRHLAPSSEPSARARRVGTWRIVFAVLAVLAICGGAAFALTTDDTGEAPASVDAGRTSSSTSSTIATTTTQPPRRATLAFSGDVLIHSPVWAAAATPAGYDFSPMLAPVAGQLSAADVAICHLEVTLARPEDSLSSYPRFRVPRQLAGDLADAGFDGCSVASNHALDFGEEGVISTLEALDDADLAHVGTARGPAENMAPAIYDAGGIEVAHLSYAYGFNGFLPPSGKEWLVDKIDVATILADARAARAAGAELVVVSLHWGNEYTHDVVAAQQQVADGLAAAPGVVDIVMGHHAHVVQPISKVGAMWVVWGMGNMLSNNAPRCCPAESTDGVIVTVTIGDVGAANGDVGVLDLAFTPTWNERDTYRVLPAAATLATGGISDVLAAELRSSFERTAAFILSLGATDLGVAPDENLPP